MVQPVWVYGVRATKQKHLEFVLWSSGDLRQGWIPWSTRVVLSCIFGRLVVTVMIYDVSSSTYILLGIRAVGLVTKSIR